MVNKSYIVRCMTILDIYPKNQICVKLKTKFMEGFKKKKDFFFAEFSAKGCVPLPLRWKLLVVCNIFSKKIVWVKNDPHVVNWILHEMGYSSRCFFLTPSLRWEDVVIFMSLLFFKCFKQFEHSFFVLLKTYYFYTNPPHTQKFLLKYLLFKTFLVKIY